MACVSDEQTLVALQTPADYHTVILNISVALCATAADLGRPNAIEEHRTSSIFTVIVPSRENIYMVASEMLYAESLAFIVYVPLGTSVLSIYSVSYYHRNAENARNDSLARFLQTSSLILSRTINTTRS